MSTRIEDYAMIGDCETVALVGRNGSIDWLCWPRFDSGAIFAALLGSPENGFWSIAPVDGIARTNRKYRDGTLILETEFETTDGAVLLIDYMTVRKGGSSHVVRIARGLRGQVRMCSRLVMRFDYGSIVPWVNRSAPDAIKAIAGPDMVVLRSDQEFQAEGMSHASSFTLGPGQTAHFVLSYGSSFKPIPDAIDPMEMLDVTTRGWQGWTERYVPRGPYTEDVLRSLITLKALTYRQTGGIVAAPTTSLPERLGGERNWDYRFCWLRDATFTLLSLLNCGFDSEADAWRTWLRHAVAGNPGQVQIMYGLAGERRLPEYTLSWLDGFQGSKPVRVGNAAAGQLQFDIFGEVMDALFQAQMAGLATRQTDWDLQLKLVEHLETIWREPDEGIWEFRSGRRHFTHSKVMAWVAFDRAIKSIENFALEGPLQRWRSIRDEIHAQVCKHGYDENVGSFVQSYGSTDLDASCLLIALVGFLPPSDPRIKGTVETIGSKLRIDGLIRRYDVDRSKDGLAGDEGAFLACSFWYADNLVLQGRRDEAVVLFEYLLSLRNDVGLLAEEYDPVARRMLGNFPQAFSHVALINTAHNLSTSQKPAERRSGHKCDRES